MFNFLTFLLTVTIIIFVILGLIYFINIPTNDYEKHSAYECGFEPFGDARSFFDIHFYTIGLLFIIFDLEIVFLIPFAIDIESTLAYEYFNFILFMVILLVGFYYEWAIGLLNWVPSKKFKAKNAALNYSAVSVVLCLDTPFNEESNLIFSILGINLFYTVVVIIVLVFVLDQSSRIVKKNNRIKLFEAYTVGIINYSIIALAVYVTYEVLKIYNVEPKNILPVYAIIFTISQISMKFAANFDSDTEINSRIVTLSCFFPSFFQKELLLPICIQICWYWLEQHNRQIVVNIVKQMCTALLTKLSVIGLFISSVVLLVIYIKAPVAHAAQAAGKTSTVWYPSELRKAHYDFVTKKVTDVVNEVFTKPRVKEMVEALEGDNKPKRARVQVPVYSPNFVDNYKNTGMTSRVEHFMLEGKENTRKSGFVTRSHSQSLHSHQMSCSRQVATTHRHAEPTVFMTEYRKCVNKNING